MVVLVDVEEKVPNGLVELFGRVEVVAIENFLFGQLPEPFDEVEIGGVWGKKAAFYGELLCQGDGSFAVLISGIVQDYGDGT